MTTLIYYPVKIINGSYILAPYSELFRKGKNEMIFQYIKDNVIVVMS